MQRVQPQRLVGNAIEQFGKVLADRLGRAVQDFESPGIRDDIPRFELGDQTLGFLEKP